MPGNVDPKLIKKAAENKEIITNRPADLLTDRFEDFKNNLREFCKKLEIHDLSSIEEHVLTFILIPYGSEQIFKKSAS